MFITFVFHFDLLFPVFFLLVFLFFLLSSSSKLCKTYIPLARVKWSAIATINLKDIENEFFVVIIPMRSVLPIDLPRVIKYWLLQSRVRDKCSDVNVIGDTEADGHDSVCDDAA